MIITIKSIQEGTTSLRVAEKYHKVRDFALFLVIAHGLLILGLDYCSFTLICSITVILIVLKKIISAEIRGIITPITEEVNIKLYLTIILTITEVVSPGGGGIYIPPKIFIRLAIPTPNKIPKTVENTPIISPS